MEKRVGVREFMSWVYGGDYPAEAMVVRESVLVVLSEGDIHIWNVRTNEDGFKLVVVDVEIEEDEVLNTDPYHGHGLLSDPLSLKGDFDRFVEVARQYL